MHELDRWSVSSYWKQCYTKELCVSDYITCYFYHWYFYCWCLVKQYSNRNIFCLYDLVSRYAVSIVTSSINIQTWICWFCMHVLYLLSKYVLWTLPQISLSLLVWDIITQKRHNTHFIINDLRAGARITNVHYIPGLKFSSYNLRCSPSINFVKLAKYYIVHMFDA